MNSITRMPNISFGLGHGVTVASDSGHDSDACAMKAQMGKTDSSEKLVPFFSGVSGEIDEITPFLFLCLSYERHEVVVKRGCVDTVAFRRKTDRALMQVDVVERDRGFGDPTTLSHCHEPRIMHPLFLFAKCRFDLRLLIGGDFRLLFWGNSFVAKFKTRIGIDVIAPDCFLEDRRENFQLRESGIERPWTNKVARWIGAKLRISPANLVRYLKRRDYVDVVQVRCNRRPCVRVSCQSFRIRILITKESWHPIVEAVALSVSIDVQFAHRVLCRYLFDLSERAVVVDSNLGAFVCPGGVWALVPNPVKRTCVSLVIGCHAVQHSAAKQDSSMTVSRGK